MFFFALQCIQNVKDLSKVEHRRTHFEPTPNQLRTNSLVPFGAFHVVSPCEVAAASPASAADLELQAGGTPLDARHSFWIKRYQKYRYDQVCTKVNQLM